MARLSGIGMEIDHSSACLLIVQLPDLVMRLILQRRLTGKAEWPEQEKRLLDFGYLKYRVTFLVPLQRLISLRNTRCLLEEPTAIDTISLRWSC